MKYRRNITDDILGSLKAENYLIDIIIGPRQVGKTTTANEISKKWKGNVHYANSDLSADSGKEWIVFHWENLRKMNHKAKSPGLLIFDEIQKIHNWSEAVKGLWDEDRRVGNRIKVLLLGSSSLLLSKGLTESLSGRFLLHRFTHWGYGECRKAFGWDIDKWIYYGGYPGAAQFANDTIKWKSYITDSLIDTVITRDVLALQTVTKPALLRNLFLLSAAFPAQILSYNKMLGQMHDAGNTTTLTHYMKLLEMAFLVSGLDNYSGSVIKTRSSSPKLILWNNALINALDGRDFKHALADRTWWGRLVENAVGAHLVNNLQSLNHKVMYWHDNNHEVDFVISSGQQITAIEVKSGLSNKKSSLNEFCRKYPKAQPIVIGSGGMPFEEFFQTDLMNLLNNQGTD